MNLKLTKLSLRLDGKAYSELVKKNNGNMADVHTVCELMERLHNGDAFSCTLTYNTFRELNLIGCKVIANEKEYEIRRHGEHRKFRDNFVLNLEEAGNNVISKLDGEIIWLIHHVNDFVMPFRYINFMENYFKNYLDKKFVNDVCKIFIRRISMVCQAEKRKRNENV